MSLPESKQDASLAGTYEARPGASDTNPAGLSSSMSNKNLSSSVKSSLDSVADSTPSTSTQSVTESLPPMQEAADAVKAGANSLVAGVSNLALGVNNVVAGNASAAHPESDNARNVDDLHIPGAFEEATDDTEDKAAVQKGLQSAYNTVPSVKDVTNTLPTTQDVKNSLPDTSAVSQKMPNISGNSDSVGGNSRQGDIHQDGIEHIKGQLQGQTSAYNTTSQLAGQVPLEPRGVPQVVSDSQRQAGVSPEAASNAGAVLEKRQLERELKREVPESQSTISSANPISSAAGLDRGVPQVVADSQKKADVSPEASANAEAVQEKRDVERQLKREVGQQPGTDNTPVNLGEAVSGGLVSAGAAIAGAATYARQQTHETTGTDPVAVLPESAQQAIDGEVTNPSTSRGPQSSSNLTNIDGQSIKNTLAGGVAAAGSATADAATYARQKTHEATGTDPVSVLPQSAQQAIDGDTSSSTSSRGLGSGSQQSGLTDSLAAGASSAGSAAAGAAAYAREKTHEATGTDPVSVLPTSAQRNIDGGKTGGDLAQTSDKFPRVVGEPVVGGSSSSTSDIFPRVVGEPVIGGHSSGVDLQSGVHNGVVGDHLDDESKSAMRSSSGSHSGHWQPGTSATVAHIPSLRDVDLSAGVKNTVVGSGAEAGEESAQ